MGASFGSVHVRTTDRQAVLRAAEAVGQQCRVVFKVAPTLEGWTTLFPSGKGQDEKSTHALAALLPQFDILHVVLHDDDVFAYGFFRAGALLDEYNSCPDYFGDVPAEGHDRQLGRPERFADVLGSNLASVDLVLHGGADDAMARFVRFAKILGLPNVMSSFEDLEDGETEGIVGLKQFVQVPDDRAAKRAQQDALKAAKEEQHARGALLSEFSGKKGRIAAANPVVCPAGGGDFLFCWAGFEFTAPYPVLRAGPAGWKKPAPVGIDLDPQLLMLAASASGRLLVAAIAGNAPRVELWDLPGRRKTAVAQTPDAIVTGAAISADESLLWILSRHKLQCVRTADGTVAYSIGLQDQARLLAVHPDARYSVVDSHGQLLIVDLESQCPIRRLFISGRYDIGRDMVRQTRWRLDAETIPAQKELWQRNLDQAMRVVGTVDPRERRGNESLTDVTFCSDGRLLLLATDHGARVYEWASVLAANENMPEPLFAADAELVRYELTRGHDHFGTRTTAIAYDQRHYSMLYAGIEGKVGSIDLASGQRTIALEVPGRPPISAMHLSADASSLAIAFAPVHFERAPRTPRWLQFWRYPLS